MTSAVLRALLLAVVTIVVPSGRAVAAVDLNGLWNIII